MSFFAINKNFIIGFVATICITGIIPASGQLHHTLEVLTSQEGLSDNRITCVFKDKTGYVWVGTKNGLNRYDGHHFSIFKPQQDNSISNEVINAIAEDKDGIIWVATMKGLNSYDPFKKKWTLYPAGNLVQSEALPNPIVWSCFVDSNNRVWVSTDTHGPSVLETDRKTFRHYNWKAFVKEKKPALATAYFSVIKMIPAGNEIYLGSTVGLFKFNNTDGSFSWLGEANRNSVQDMQYDAATKRVYLTTSKKELFCYDEKRGKYEQLFPDPLSFPSSSISSLAYNHTWIGFPDGLVVADKKTGNMLLQSQLSTIASGSINTVYHDNTGITWVATDDGLAKYDPNSQFFSFLPLTNKPANPSFNSMGAAYYDRTTDSYFVCSKETGEVFIINRSNGKITAKKTAISQKELGACYAIKPDRMNQLWLLTSHHVYKYNRETGEFTLFPTPNGNNEALFRNMVQDHNGNYWFASFHGPLYFYDSKKKLFTSPGNDTAFNTITKVTSLHFDTANHIIWIGTFSNGLHKFDISAEKITSYNAISSSPAYESLHLIHDLYQDAHHRLWAATHTGGLFYYQPGKSYEEAFVQVSMKEGLASNTVYAITGNDSLIWAMSGKNITVLNSRTSTFIEVLQEQAGFPFTSFSSLVHEPHYISFDSKRKELLIAAGGGLLLYKTSARSRRLNFPVLLSAVSVNGHALPDSNWQNASPATFSHPLKEIKFNFAALHYSRPSFITYQYRLVGYEDEWKNISRPNELFYQNLPPGSYTFQLKATDFAGYTSAKQVAFSFTIVPPFWRTAWFGLAIILLLVVAVYLWIQQLRKKIGVEQQLNRFAVSLYGKNSVDDILWDIATNCIQLLKFEDCVVYRYAEEKKVLVQVAAAGPKKIKEKQLVFNPIEIPLGKGIVGTVASSGKPEIIANTRKDKRYIIDDAVRTSEITVPILIEGKIFGVIDSESTHKNFYTKWHLALLQKVATVCADKLIKLIAEEKLRDVIARDLHDEMGSTLTSIHILSNLALQEGGGKDMPYLEKIKKYTGNMMDKMSDIIWAINPQHDTVERLLLRMKEFAVELLEPAGITHTIETSGIEEGPSLSPEERKFLYLIFKEALNNSVKYSNATTVSIILDKSETQLQMILSDNGTGFDPATVHKGNGLKNMEVRAHLIGATLSIQSKTGNGTIIKLAKNITS